MTWKQEMQLKLEGRLFWGVGEVFSHCISRKVCRSIWWIKLHTRVSHGFCSQPRQFPKGAP